MVGSMLIMRSIAILKREAVAMYIARSMRVVDTSNLWYIKYTHICTHNMAIDTTKCYTNARIIAASRLVILRHQSLHMHRIDQNWQLGCNCKLC